MNVYYGSGSSCSCAGIISGNVYEDKNTNGIKDAGETGKPNIMIHASSSTGNYYGYTDNYGYYSIYVSCNHTYQIKVADSYNNIITSPPAPGTYTVSVDTSGISSLNNIDFGYVVTPFVDLVVGGMLDWGSQRPGFPVHFIFYYVNIGSVTSHNITLSISYDTKLNYTGAALTPSSSTGGTLTWNFDSLRSGQSGSMQVDFVIDPLAAIGSYTYLVATINPTSGDYDPTNNMKNCPFFLSGAYDPNDKSVEPVGAGPQNNIYKDDNLSYTIRFQNTGNADAINIFVKDTIDTDLDLGSLHTTMASHYYEVCVDSNRIVTWNFPNIHLPDSGANQQASHGYIQYSIRQNPNNPDGTLIKNKAGIYFDFNAPVITNETMNTIASNITFIHTSASPNETISVFPNPARDRFIVTCDQEKLNFILLDLTGKTISSGNSGEEMNISKLERGMYIMKLQGSAGAFYKKVILE